MKVKVRELREAFKLLEGVVPKTTKIPILRYVLFKDGKATAGNMETFVQVDLPEADIDFLVPHRAVLDMLNYVPGDETSRPRSTKS